jgi:AcrR family transcriptional regulator
VSTVRPYRAATRSSRSERTRERITAAVRGLLEEGSFHSSTVEEVAERAGVSRATLYQHFGSRLDLVDAICDTFAVNPALLELREVVELPDPEAALDETIAHSIRFWATEDPVLSELYGVVAIDPAAGELVARQRADRRGEMQRLARHLEASGRLRAGLRERDATDLLMVLTSYETYRELRASGRSDRRLTSTLQESARRLLVDTPA